MRNDITTFVLAGPQRAATVITLAEIGAGPVREAIDNAVIGETISSSSGGTITLTSGGLLIDELIFPGSGPDRRTVKRSTASGTRDFGFGHSDSHSQIPARSIGVLGATVSDASLFLTRERLEIRTPALVCPPVVYQAMLGVNRGAH
jgi:hypothetical protein